MSCLMSTLSSRRREKTFVAQFKFTVLLLPGGTKKVTGIQLDEAKVASALSVQDEELKKLLASSANPKKNKKKKQTGPKDKADEDAKYQQKTCRRSFSFVGF